MISFSVLYGKELGNFISNLFKSGSAIDTLKTRIDALNSAYDSKELKSGIESLIELRRNIDLAQAGYVNKQDVLKTYNEQFGRVLGTTNSVNEAEKKLVDATPTLINALINRAASTKLVADAAQTLIEIQKEEEQVKKESIKTTNFQLGQLNDQLNRGFITQKEYFKKSREIFDANSIEQSVATRRNGAGRLADLRKQYQNEINLALDFGKKSEDVLKGAGLVDGGSKEAADATLKAAQELADKQKKLLEERVQGELNAAQEVYIKSISIQGATIQDKENAEIKLLEAQIAIFEKYKKADKQYAQDSLDTREKLAEKILNINEDARKEYLKSLQEEYKADDAFMKKTIDNELDLIDKKYVEIKQGATLTSDEQLALDLKKTQEEIAYLELVKDAGEKYSDDLIKLKEKESDLITRINKKTNNQIIDDDKRGLDEVRKIQLAFLDVMTTVSSETFDSRRTQLQQETNVQIEELNKQREARLITEEQFNTKKKELLNEQARKQREYDLAQIKVQTALAIIKAFATGLTPFDRILGAALAATQGAIQYSFASSQPLPQFAKGTDRVVGGRKGVDSVHALLMPDEAVIPTKQNLARPGLAKAWIDGNLDRHLAMNYIKPAIEENNKRWEASLKVNQSSTFIRNDNFNDKNIVKQLVKSNKINQRLINNLASGKTNRRNNRLWNLG